MKNEEKTETKERLMRLETKTALMAVGLLLLSVALLYSVAYSDSDQMTKSDIIGGGIGGGIFGVSVGVIVGGIFGVIVGGIGGGIGGVIVGSIFGGIGGGTVGGIFGGIGGGLIGEKVEKVISLWTLLILLFIFLFPFAILIVPLSKYHNYRQIERDNKITEVLQITVLEEGVKLLLPDQYAGENSYLKKVFSLGWEGEENKKKWQELAITCQEGDKHWFYATLPFPENKTAKLEMFFDHAWEDYITTKEVSLK